jgi:hypothetical protein
VGSAFLTAVERRPFRGPSLPWDQRVDGLLQRLTLEERIALLHAYALRAPARRGHCFPAGRGTRRRPGRGLSPAPPADDRLRHREPCTWPPAVDLSRDPCRGQNEDGCQADPPHTGRPTTACCRGLGHGGQYPKITNSPDRRSHHRVEATFAARDRFDGDRFAQRATVPALFGADVMAPLSPPSTVCTVINDPAGQDRTVTVWSFPDHDGGCGSNPPTRLARPHRRGLSPEL